MDVERALEPLGNVAVAGALFAYEKELLPILQRKLGHV